jgi:uncharacterized membrane protein YkvA (DUF1232 family)
MIEKIKIWANNIKKNLSILYCAYMNKKTPWYAKIMIGIVIAYALSPIDLIPDFIPILGYLDDLLLIPLGILISFKLIPKDVLEECKNDEAAFNGMGKRGKYGAVAVLIIWAIIIYLVFKKIFFHA